MNPQKTKLSIPLILLIGAIAAQTITSCSSADIPDLPPPDGENKIPNNNCVEEELKIGANTLNDVIEACDGVKKSEILSMLSDDIIGICDKNDLEFKKPIKDITQECSPWSITTDREDEDAMSGYKGTSTVENAKVGDGYKVLFNDNRETFAQIQNYKLGNPLRDSKGEPYEPHLELILDVVNPKYEYLLDCQYGFSYEYKGSAHRFMGIMSTITNYNYNGKNIASSATNWTTVETTFDGLEQDNWGQSLSSYISFNKAYLIKMRWEVNGNISSSTGSLAIKNLGCLQ